MAKETNAIYHININYFVSRIMSHTSLWDHTICYLSMAELPMYNFRENFEVIPQSLLVHCNGQSNVMKHPVVLVYS